MSRAAPNKSVPPAIRKSSGEIRHEAATSVITTATTRATTVATVVPFTASARADDDD
jgi:hypothetical protein